MKQITKDSRVVINKFVEEYPEMTTVLRPVLIYSSPRDVPRGLWPLNQ